MPGYDGTGPRGEGPMTGGGFGRCTGFARPFYGRGGGFGRGLARGYGRGFGLGMAWRNGWRGRADYAPYVPPAPSKEEEAVWLKSSIDGLQGELEEMKKRLSELES